MNALKIEHDRIDYLLAQAPEDPTDHALYDIVVNMASFPTLTSYLDALVQTEFP